MRSEARVVVIGGGVVGCSVLYHLTKLGWRDVVLLERDELTSGSTWHAAGGMHTLNSDPNVAKLQDYTIRLYKEIEAISGQSCGIHLTGGIMLAGTRERLDFLKTAHARGRLLGLESEFISLEEVRRRHPLIETSHFAGALFDPYEGHIDPSGVTHAYARSAQKGGAEINRFTPVTELVATADGGWRVVTPKGEIRAEIVVNAGGLWAREVGRLVGLELPVLAMEHHYLITEDLPEIAERSEELPHAIDFEAEIYTRQEGRGLVLGTYERACVPWSPKTTPMDFGHELLAPDLDRIAPSLEVAFAHFPALERAGIKRVINGPFTFAPDGNPLVGPVPGLRNFYCACGVMAGFSQGGGVGLALANWIVEGDPGMDVFAMDVARFGDFATRAYTNAKVRENYSRRFSITFPNEELPAARPQRTTPVYDRLKAEGAVFGASFGLEHALWFAPAGSEPHEVPTFRRSNAHEPVGRECRAVRDGVGLLEIANYGKHEIAGPGAEAWLDRLLAGRLPRAGRLALAPMLAPSGRLMGDLTVARLATERFMIVGSGVAERFHLRWFEHHLPPSGVSVRPIATERPGFALAGPRSREVLAALTDEDVTAEAFRFFDIRRIDVGTVPAWVARVSFTGELGFEIYVDAAYQLALYDELVRAGAEHGLVHFGGRALNALRLEKSFGAWLREYTPDVTPAEAGLARFVDLDKGDFIGRAAVLRQQDEAPRHELVTLVVDAADADAYGDEPVLSDGRVVGFT
ncbi:MAG: glycine cleavage system protein, partial [Geminicoccaceae bacterium]|nr:glycine cleavage system protein [Geminicoccaceae bacterium]